MAKARASLGFKDGPSLHFRIDPTGIQYNWQIYTAVHDTVGGRVIQITGSALSDITVVGDLGEDRSKNGESIKAENGQPLGGSWAEAIRFYQDVREMMKFQSKDVQTIGKPIPYATFTYEPLDIRQKVYIKGLIDPQSDGVSAVDVRVGKINHKYQLVLFPYEDTGLRKVGGPNSHFSKSKEKAIQDYLSRITKTNGLGWELTQYNGGLTGSAGVMDESSAPKEEEKDSEGGSSSE